MIRIDKTFWLRRVRLYSHERAFCGSLVLSYLQNSNYYWQFIEYFTKKEKTRKEGSKIT
jgi:hypothetical protein